MRAGGPWLRLCVEMCCIAHAGSAFAQVGGGRVCGRIADQNGGPVGGATVTATHTTVSDASGVYALPGLAPGLYRVGIQFTGFSPVRRDGVRVATGDSVKLDVLLTVASLQTELTVAAAAPLLRGDSASLGHRVDHETTVQLPLNGRSFITLAGLAPGVALAPNSSLPRINGGRPRADEYLFDGISVLQPEPGQVAFFPILDAIQEFAIETNSPRAEFGRFNGGVVHLTTKSGSNAFRGMGFEFLRHESLNARNFFSSAIPVKPKYRRNQFGGVFGGPIRRDHTFFFADYSGAAADDCTHRHFDRADDSPASGCVQ